MLKLLLIAVFVPAIFTFDQPCRTGTVPIEVTSVCSPDCVIANGVPLDIKALFTAEFDTLTVTPKVQAIWLGRVIDMPLPDGIQNGCQDIAEGCPLIAGNQYTYAVDLTPDTDFPIPGINVTVEVSLIGDDNQVIVCAAMDAVIPLSLK